MKRTLLLLFLSALLTGGYAQIKFKLPPTPVQRDTIRMQPRPVDVRQPPVEKVITNNVLVQSPADDPPKYVKLNTWRNKVLIVKTVSDSLPVALASQASLTRLESLRVQLLRALNQSPAVASLYDSGDSLFRPLQCSRFVPGVAFISEHTARDLEHLLTLLNAYVALPQFTVNDVKMTDTLLGMVNATISKEVRFFIPTTFALTTVTRIQPVVQVDDSKGRDVTTQVRCYFVNLFDFRSVVKRHVSATVPVSGSGSLCLSTPSEQCMAELKSKNSFTLPTSTLPMGRYNVLVTSVQNGVETQVSCFACNFGVLGTDAPAEGANPFVRRVTVPLKLTTEL